jgi:PPOX class probable F420-dependent enzyme
MQSLENGSYLNLATFRRTGVAVETPVWFAPVEGRLYVFTAGSSGKVKRLRNSSRARVAPCNGWGKLQGEWIDASARVVDDPETVRRAYAALRSKYGLQMWLTDFFSRLSGRIDQRAIVEIELSP